MNFMLIFVLKTEYQTHRTTVPLYLKTSLRCTSTTTPHNFVIPYQTKRRHIPEYLPPKLHGVTYLNINKLHDVTNLYTYIPNYTSHAWIPTYQTTWRHIPEYLQTTCHIPKYLPQTTRRHIPEYLPNYTASHTWISTNYTTSQTCIPTPKLHDVTYLYTYPQTTQRHIPEYLPPKLLDVTYLNTYLPNYTASHSWITTSQTTRCHIPEYLPNYTASHTWITTSQTTRRHIPEYLPPKLHGVSHHNTVISMTAVRTSNVAADLLFMYLTQ